jgi:hypothetical protein
MAILAEVGKVGDMENNYFVPTKEKWKIDKGQYYDYNENISFMRVPHRSLFLTKEFSIPLSSDEYLAILLSDGNKEEGVAAYRYREPKLATLLQHAIKWAEISEKENIINYP